jgi:hypothetical protein
MSKKMRKRIEVDGDFWNGRYLCVRRARGLQTKREARMVGVTVLQGSCTVHEEGVFIDLLYLSA